MGNENSKEVTSGAISTMTLSVRSDMSKESTNSSRSSSVRISSLHGNMMRTHLKRDPMKVFEVVAVLGEGSMGSVSRVRKRESAIGGSARPDFVKSSKNQCCAFFSFLSFASANKSVLTPTNSTRSTASLEEVSDLSIGTNDKTLKRASSSMIRYGRKKEVNYALKSIHLDRCSNKEYIDELRNEIDILRGIDHPNIVRVIETFDYKERVYIALELCSGGDLYSRDPYTEYRAIQIVCCMLSAVCYLHTKGICHRDLKFENVCFADKSAKAEVKIIDFGLSQKFAANEHLHETVGTVYTMAPELLAGDYDSKADVWSIGVIAFMLLSSSLPFYGKDRNQVIRRVVRGEYRFASRRWKGVSEQGVNFCKLLLMVKPEDRPSAEEALRLDWLNSNPEGGNLSNLQDAEMMDNIQASIMAFAEYGVLKKLALMVVAYKSTSAEVGYLRRMFNRFDKINDGEICYEEFTGALCDHYDYSEEELERMFGGLDIDGTESVHYSEFLAATIESHGAIDEERLAEAFDRIDSDDTGFISIENLRDFLGDDVPDAYLERIIDEADILHDHRISYEEFLALWDKEGDVKISDAKKVVKSKRHSRLSALRSLAPSESASPTSTDRQSTTSSTEGADLGGSFYYKEAKELSVRGAWI